MARAVSALQVHPPLNCHGARVCHMRGVSAPRRLVSQCIAAQRSLRHLNAFTSFREDQAPSPVDGGPLSELLVAVKDNICTTDLPTTCGSRVLSGYSSPYDATVVRLLRAAGATITGKTNLDEFGMGSHSVYSAFGPVQNVVSGFSAGGSSGGSAVAVATGQCHAALGTDTGGSVRIPAAYNGVVGFKPSYGLISRWGVVSYSNSLDTVGILAADLGSVRSLFERVSNYDALDPTSLPSETRTRLLETRGNQAQRKSLRIGVPIEYNVSELAPIVREAWSRSLRHLQELGHTIHQVSLPSTEQALSAYYVLAPGEASSNLAKYDGVRYGGTLASESEESPQTLYASTRHTGFGDEVRRRILLGSYSLSAEAIDNYFIQAQRVRRLVQDDFDRVFGLVNVLTEHEAPKNSLKIDALVCPTVPTLPPALDDLARQTPIDSYAGDVLTVPASLAGLPAISVPVGLDPLLLEETQAFRNVGVQVIAQYGDDETALNVAAMLEGLQSRSS